MRGGWRQRLAVETAMEGQHADSSISRLAAGQLLLWADGAISAAQLQRTMCDALADGLDHPMVKRLADLPPEGRAQQALMDLI